MSSADIYREIILDYYRNPRNYGKIESPDISKRDSNPLCGDELEMHINLIICVIKTIGIKMGYYGGHKWQHIFGMIRQLFDKILRLY